MARKAAASAQLGPQPSALDANAPSPLPRLRPPAASSSPSPLEWIPVVSLDVKCSARDFHDSLANLVLQPEQSSSTILRADILADERDLLEDNHENVTPVPGFRCRRRLRRRILPSRPQFDWAMEQECLFYERTREGLDSDDDAADREGLVLLLPDLEQLKVEDPEGRLPYYHPQVYALAFRYLPHRSAAFQALLRIDLVPLPSQPPLAAPIAPSDRLFRTALVLIKFVAKLCAGHAEGWQKRVHHDLLVGKEEVQDLYQQLKDQYKYVKALERLRTPDTEVSRPTRNSADIAAQSPRITFRWMLADWPESTDATKHVFEDVAIAAWLINLWRKIYAASHGKPPGGFVDVGCGNGLLVFILHAEGFEGYGFDLRARKSWAAYSPTPDLRVSSILPPAIVAEYLSTSTPAFPPGSFLIGNHADELTPWLPLFAACTPRSAFLNVPCCLHELHGRFDRQEYTIPSSYLSALPPSPHLDESAPSHANSGLATHPLLYPFYAPTPLAYTASAKGPSIVGGRYAAYQLYLAHLTLRCGFVPEREALRIPSTKNFGMVGRRSLFDVDDSTDAGDSRVRGELESMLREVERSGEWRARKPEGKAGDKEH